MIRLLVILLGGALAIPAQSTNPFAATGKMSTTRIGHTATLLKDGRVLIAGGSSSLEQGGVVLASAEVYDPATGIFFATGDMTIPRSRHTATLLQDGRVLITGGQTKGSLDAVNTAEVFDPATGKFTATGNMGNGYSFHSANLLANGKVLITAGPGNLPSAALYDPITGVFTPAGALKLQGSAALLNNGNVLIAGNADESLYVWKDDALQFFRRWPGSDFLYRVTTSLANGKVLITGGDQDYGEVTTGDAAIYDPRKATVRDTGLLLISRDSHTATLLPGGRVLIAGGYNDEGYDFGITGLTEAEEYNPSTGTFASVGNGFLLRSGHTATLLPDGRVLLLGGNETDATAEIYSPPARAGSAASFEGSLAPESLASLFGARLAAATESADPGSPSTSLGGISLRVRDSAGGSRLAPLLYVSPAQINFEVPAGTAAGNVALEVVNAAGQVIAVSAGVAPVAPGLFADQNNVAAAYAVRVEPGGAETVLSAQNTIVLDERPVYLIAYGTGIRNRSSLDHVSAAVGGVSLPVEYAGPGGGVPGLDQVNVRLTTALTGSGVSDLVLTVDGAASAAVSVDMR